MLGKDLSRIIHTRHPKNMADLKQFCEEEWYQISPERCEGLELELEILNIVFIESCVTLVKIGWIQVISFQLYIVPNHNRSLLRVLYIVRFRTLHSIYIIKSHLCRKSGQCKQYHSFFLQLYIQAMVIIYNINIYLLNVIKSDFLSKTKEFPNDPKLLNVSVKRKYSFSSGVQVDE